jgi:hypothetical protein
MVVRTAGSSNMKRSAMIANGGKVVALVDYDGGAIISGAAKLQ